MEKIAISAAALRDPALVAAIARALGSQSVVVVYDVRRRLDGSDYDVYTHNGRVTTGLALTAVVSQAASLGAGEILVNSIDRDGTMQGYDLALARVVRAATSLPMTVLGGASSLADIGRLIAECGVVGAAAGSLFVFKGSRKAVLINYPGQEQKDEIVRAALTRPGSA